VCVCVNEKNETIFPPNTVLLNFVLSVKNSIKREKEKKEKDLRQDGPNNKITKIYTLDLQKKIFTINFYKIKKTTLTKILHILKKMFNI